MSPIDDELRAALRGRADAISPAPDPLGGIESRARGIRRRRAGATIAGAALAVAAVAIAVPTLTGTDKASDPGRFTTVAPTTAPPSTPVATATPSNVIPWIMRGKQTLDPAFVDRMVAAYESALSAPHGQLVYRLLYAGDTDSRVSFVLGQVWKEGDAAAHTFAYAEGGTNGPQVFLGTATPMAAQLVAAVIDSLPGTTTDLLVLVPRPGTGQLSYSPDATTPFAPVANGRSDLDGVGLVDRSTTATNDPVEQLDGDGNLDNPIYRGPIAPYLCGDKECG